MNCAEKETPVNIATGTLKKTTTDTQTVTQVRHWTDRLFSFKTTRNAGFRFKNGHFTMIGLELEGKPLMRAYSLASANYEDELEFFSIKVPDGPLTSKLQEIKVGDGLLVNSKSTGTLVQDNDVPFVKTIARVTRSANDSIKTGLICCLRIILKGLIGSTSITPKMMSMYICATHLRAW